MVRQFFKKKSKRVSTRTRTKIERKVRQHNKKVKKEAKKHPGKSNKRKKDPGVPNSFPFKEEVLKEAEEHNRRLEEERQKQKEKRKRDKEKLLMKRRSLDGLVKDAQKRTEDFNRKGAVSVTAKEFTGGKAVESSLKAYYKEFRKVIEAADVILEVLDARDPIGSRCPEVEEAVLGAGTNKKLVLLLNKIDLVPKENVEKWLKYLRNEFPTLAFKASTQTQSENLGHVRLSMLNAKEDLRKTSRCLGADMLMKLLGNYCRNQDIRTSITVGIVGFPNTGKSSIINSLKRSKACNVGATPGVTKSMQDVQLDKHIKLLDSPGIVMAAGLSDTSTILRNCVKVETLQDPVTPVTAILKRCQKHQMMLHYNIANFSDVHEFLALLAKRFGRLKKGGVPDINKAAKQVLQDWNHGKIRYYTHPPEQHTLATHVSAEIVSQMSKEFDIDALLAEEQAALKELKAASNSDFVVESSGPTAGVVSEDQEDEMEDEEDEDVEDEDDEEEEDEEEDESGSEEEMEEDESEEELGSVTVSVSSGRSSRTSSATQQEMKKPSASVAPRPVDPLMLNKARKQEFKKIKKQRRRADALGGKLSDALSDAFSGLGEAEQNEDEDYDFTSHF